MRSRGDTLVFFIKHDNSVMHSFFQNKMQIQLLHILQLTFNKQLTYISRKSRTKILKTSFVLNSDMIITRKLKESAHPMKD